MRMCVDCKKFKLSKTDGVICTKCFDLRLKKIAHKGPEISHLTGFCNLCQGNCVIKFVDGHIGPDALVAGLTQPSPLPRVYWTCEECNSHRMIGLAEHVNCYLSLRLSNGAKLNGKAATELAKAIRKDPYKVLATSELPKWNGEEPVLNLMAVDPGSGSDYSVFTITGANDPSLNGTWKVKPEKTASEIQQMALQNGAVTAAQKDMADSALAAFIANNQHVLQQSFKKPEPPKQKPSRTGRILELE